MPTAIFVLQLVLRKLFVCSRGNAYVFALVYVVQAVEEEWKDCLLCHIYCISMKHALPVLPYKCIPPKALPK